MAIASPVWSHRQEEPRFRGGIELINVIVTVTHDDGRFVGDLSREDFSSTAAKDGRWHSIRVEVRGRRVNVRARRGYSAS
jgi:hypothetical protein